MQTIPEAFHDLLADETRAFLALATTMPDGTPQVTPIWFNFDGEHILINSARGRAKDRNMTARPHVAALIFEPANPWRWIQIRGEVVEITEEGALDHILDLALKYRGRREYDPAGNTRVTYKIRPDHVTVFPASPHQLRNR
jgi:PPOX class probable F420-dependent enzyme